MEYIRLGSIEMDLRRGTNMFRDIEYAHLIDGDRADHLGIKSLRSALIEPHDDIGVLRAISEGVINTSLS